MNGQIPPPIPKKPPRVKVRPPSANTKEWLFRLLVALLMVGACSLLGWSFFGRLAPLQKQARDLGGQVSRLSAEVDALERAMDRANPAQVIQNFRRVNLSLFSDETALASWLTELETQNLTLALELKADFGPAAIPSTNDQNLAVIPTTVSVAVASDAKASQSPYQRLLRLSHHLSSQERRVDVTELKVIGGSNSIQQATLVLNLWAGKEPAE